MLDGERYEGAEIASIERVKRYLADWYHIPDDLDELLLEHAEVVRRYTATGSYAYWVGDEVAVAAGLKGKLKREKG